MSDHFNYLSSDQVQLRLIQGSVHVNPVVFLPLLLYDVTTVFSLSK